jgi:hypothetical protein
VAEVAASPAAEVCWYFPNSREQYRIAGTLTIVDDQHPSQQLLKVGGAGRRVQRRRMAVGTPGLAWLAVTARRGSGPTLQLLKTGGALPLQARQKAWSSMSEGGRAQFTWPDPGLPRDGEAAFSRPVPAAQVRVARCVLCCSTGRTLLSSGGSTVVVPLAAGPCAAHLLPGGAQGQGGVCPGCSCRKPRALVPCAAWPAVRCCLAPGQDGGLEHARQLCVR